MECLTLGMNEDVAVMAIIFGVGGAVAVIAIVFDTMQKVTVTRQREITKREVAAYVAEGSMTPEDAERIIKAGKNTKQSKA
jgi:hypothetical protein